MLFVSIEFVIFFLLVLPLNWFLRPRPKLYRLFLLTASYFFYGRFDIRFLLILANFSLWTWGLSLVSGKSTRPWVKRLCLNLNLLVGLGGLAFFKYYGFFVESLGQIFPLSGLGNSLPMLDLILPVGISFFTFQGLSYAMDVYRDPSATQADPLDVFVFIAFFPTLLSGPILRARDLVPQLDTPTTGAEASTRGFLFLISGLFKKIFISSYLSSHIVQNVFEMPESFSSFAVLLGAVGYSIQIYADFSGYSDMAMGIALLLGFSIPNNFDAPYKALSLRTFWHRWHISLSTWLRDYLYFSLGGNRKGTIRKYFNLFVTMTLGGLWHGANLNFLIWGMLHGGGLILVHLFQDIKKKLGLAKGAVANAIATKAAYWLLTFSFVTLAWIFFRAETFDQAMALIGRILAFSADGFGVNAYVPVIIAGVLLFDGMSFDWQTRAAKQLNRVPVVIQGVLLGLACSGILLLGPDGVPPFIYFSF